MDAPCNSTAAASSGSRKQARDQLLLALVGPLRGHAALAHHADVQSCQHSIRNLRIAPSKLRARLSIERQVGLERPRGRCPTFTSSCPARRRRMGHSNEFHQSDLARLEIASLDPHRGLKARHAPRPIERPWPVWARRRCRIPGSLPAPSCSSTRESARRRKPKTAEQCPAPAERENSKTNSPRRTAGTENCRAMSGAGRLGEDRKLPNKRILQRGASMVRCNDLGALSRRPARSRARVAADPAGGWGGGAGCARRWGSKDRGSSGRWGWPGAPLCPPCLTAMVTERRRPPAPTPKPASGYVGGGVVHPVSLKASGRLDRRKAPVAAGGSPCVSTGYRFGGGHEASIRSLP